MDAGDARQEGGRIEIGHSRRSLEQLERLSKFFKVTLAELPE
jgi:hypothetical protein